MLVYCYYCHNRNDSAKYCYEAVNFTSLHKISCKSCYYLRQHLFYKFISKKTIERKFKDKYLYFGDPKYIKRELQYE